MECVCLPCNPDCQQVPAGPAPEHEIAAGTKIVFNNIVSSPPLDNKKIKIFFYPSVIKCSQGFFPTVTKGLFDFATKRFVKSLMG
jgi:hypothetical protein